MAEAVQQEAQHREQEEGDNHAIHVNEEQVQLQAQPREADDGNDGNAGAAAADDEGAEEEEGQNWEAAYVQLWNQNDPQRMELTERERQLALNIKEAVANTPDLDPVSDFMCAQLALIDDDNIEAAINRLFHLQSFREQYAIVDTVADGQKCFAENISIFPKVHLSFSYCMESGEYIMIYDNAHFDPSQLSSEERMRTWLVGFYYSCHMTCPDFAAIRSGASLVMENEGYVFKSGMHAFKCIKRAWIEIISEYPVRVKRMKYFHSATAMNVMVSMLKPFFPKHLRRNIETGCYFEQRLDQIYLVPTLEEANERLLNRVAETLQRRYDNERTFRL